VVVLHTSEVPDQPGNRVRLRIGPKCQHLDAGALECRV